MAKPSYLMQLGQELGFTVLPGAETFKNNYQQGKGIALGLRQGYLVAVGLVSAGRSTSLALMVRFRRGSPKEAIESTLKSLSPFKSFTARRALKVSEDGLLVVWPYAFKKPEPQAVVAFIAEILSTIRALALPFSGKCEDCNNTEISEVTLVNRIPGYHCAACQTRFVAEKKQAAEEYNSRPANYFAGIPVAVAVAAVTGTAWGLLASVLEAGTGKWEPKLHICVGFGIASLIAVSLFKAMGKVTRTGQVLAILFTILAKFWGDALYFTFDVLSGPKFHVGTNFLNWKPDEHLMFRAILVVVLRRFWLLKLFDFWGKFVFAADLAWAISIPWLPWGKIPNFTPTFERVGPLRESVPPQYAQSFSAKSTS